ncbi:hypothetical protein I5Q34_29640 [Streptomyces sp. AV19]|uniref:hypothetical protein n=1 Tax=Streptomyces sp. AV19 TaxID=2793068 RepID=UPI0018FECECE|nr:hypothetical protein [Streptomyces sp. AV19]MBH1938372.1 hypothetical protein [Streptomyces sp. AV19]MDG4535021.1 hypothetical protein [Streptomyces sp. AV19]
MERFLDLILIRYGLVAGGLAVLALVVFVIALLLKRRGSLTRARRYGDPATQALLRAAVRRLEGRGDRR